MKTVKVKIDGYDDRNKMVNALANNGHKVWVEEKPSQTFLTEKDYHVCFEIEEGATE